MYLGVIQPRHSMTLKVGQQTFYLWRLWGWVVCRASGLVYGGFGSPARARFDVFYSDTLSARDVALSTPHGFAYCESPNGRWVGSPVGQYFLSRPLSVVT